MSPSQPTLEMVAAAAGVSRSTVSRVVNRSPSVSPRVATAVQAAIEQLSYVPNRAARSLAGSLTYAIALVVPEDVGRFFGDPYFAAVVQGITERLDESDYVLNLLVTSGGRSEKTRRYLRGGNVDGALVVSHHARDTGLRELAANLPVVFGGQPTVPGLENSYCVDVDNIEGSRQATRYLLEQGRRRIATITGPLDMQAARDRLRGWREGLAAAGMADDAVADGDFTASGGAAAMRELLHRVPDLDAVFVASDLMARGALGTLAEQGRQVPKDVAMIGFDDSAAATSGSLQLTTVAQPLARMGSQMTELLLGLLAGHQPEQRATTMPTRLVLRDTA